MNRDVINEIKQHALDEYPRECVGVVIKDDYIRLENIHEIPTKSFRVDPAEYQRIVGRKRKNVTLVHSHPYNHERTTENRYFEFLNLDRRMPSKGDVALALTIKIPMAIVSTDGDTVSDPITFNDGYDQEIIGQEYCYNINDCWTLVKRYYWQNYQVELPTFPSNFGWWSESPEQDFFARTEEAGLHEVHYADMQIGDLILFEIESSVIDHCGIWIGNSDL